MRRLLLWSSFLVGSSSIQWAVFGYGLDSQNLPESLTCGHAQQPVEVNSGQLQ
ncbi:hypothetical protein [Jiulongibacter sediminis]|uniref:hypothetical protein n=1 Tax=Jiulongibacter sediminis TaxID=1605367 RepID=UPI0026EC4355|nr:hypothetical protein [Jiulongibacter sediminis]